MQDKVRLTREQANALENFTSQEIFNADTFLVNCLKTGFMNEENQCLNKLSPSQLATCILIGYEVEPTPEEKIIEIYNIGYARNGFGEENIAFREGIALALHTFGIKAEGIHTIPEKQ